MSLKTFLIKNLPVNPFLGPERVIEPKSRMYIKAEQTIRNRKRGYAWQCRWLNRFGQWKELSPYRFQNQRHGNSNIIKMPRRKRQIVGAQYPTGPEAA